MAYGFGPVAEVFFCEPVGEMKCRATEVDGLRLASCPRVDGKQSCLIPFGRRLCIAVVLAMPKINVLLGEDPLEDADAQLRR